MSSSTSTDIIGIKKLGDFISLQRGTTYKSSLLGQPGAVLIGLASIEREGGFRSNKLETYGGECPQKISLKPGDLYVSLKDITHDGHLLGAVARIPDSIECGRLTQDTVKLVFEKELFPRNYIYWLLRTPQYRNYCRSRQTGTTNLGLGREDFLSLPVPSMTEATNAIVTALESIEKKIENLRKQNETLEAIAKALFQHWFIDFEFPNEDGKPYKSSGGEMVRSELGEIPAGWHVEKLGNLADIGTGKGLKRNEFRKDGIYPVLGANGEMGRTNKFLKEGKLILTGRVGTLGIVSLSNIKAWISDNVIIISPNSEFFYFIYFCLKNMNLKLLNRGSTQPLITQSDLKGLFFVVPDIKTLESFGLLSLSLFNKIDINQKSQRTLTKTRDVLLPNLMSGKLRITE